MSWFRRKPSGGRSKARQAVDFAHLEWFIQAKYGVEAFVEPRTAVTETTLILIAHDGEWTRRRIGDQGTAASFAKHWNIPFYEVQKVGYPQRMRDYNARRKLRPNADDSN